MEFGDGIGITHEGQTGASRDDIRHVFTRLVSQIAQNSEYGDAGQETGERIHQTDNHRVSANVKLCYYPIKILINSYIIYMPVDVVAEWIVAGEHDDRAETHWQWEETLSHGRVPSLNNIQINQSINPGENDFSSETP